jgi:hypothetical protein
MSGEVGKFNYNDFLLLMVTAYVYLLPISSTSDQIIPLLGTASYHPDLYICCCGLCLLLCFYLTTVGPMRKAEVGFLESISEW